MISAGARLSRWPVNPRKFDRTWVSSHPSGRTAPKGSGSRASGRRAIPVNGEGSTLETARGVGGGIAARINNMAGHFIALVFEQNGVPRGVDDLTYLGARTPAVPIINLVGVFRFLQDHVLVHIDHRHHFSHAIRLVSPCPMI